MVFSKPRYAIDLFHPAIRYAIAAAITVSGRHAATFPNNGPCLFSSGRYVENLACSVPGPTGVTLPYWAVPFEVSANTIAFSRVKFQNRIAYNCVLYYFLIYKHNNTNQLKWFEKRVAQKAAVYCVAPA